MTRHRNSPTIQKRLGRSDNRTDQTSSSITAMVQQVSSENLDDETKLAKRHLTKEMWQLVSIAVKRMADELASISNNQSTATHAMNSEIAATTSSSNSNAIAYTEVPRVSQQSSLLTVSQQPTNSRTDIGAGDVSVTQKKQTASNESISKRMLSIQMLDLPKQTKRKCASNNAKSRPRKSNAPNISLKRTKKTVSPSLRTSKNTSRKILN